MNFPKMSFCWEYFERFVTRNCNVGSIITAVGGGEKIHNFFFSIRILNFFFLNRGTELYCDYQVNFIFVFDFQPFSLLFVIFSGVDNSGAITALTIVDHGSNFTSMPTIVVNDPRCQCGLQVIRFLLSHWQQILIQLHLFLVWKYYRGDGRMP